MRDRAMLARVNADECRKIAEHINTLRYSPALASSSEEAFREMSKRIEATAIAMGIAEDKIAAIDPDPVVRIGDTAYLEKATEVQLREVTLPQLIGLLGKLVEGNHELCVKALWLSVPPRNESGNLWTADLTISYLIYSPLAVQRYRDSRS